MNINKFYGPIKKLISNVIFVATFWSLSKKKKNRYFILMVSRIWKYTNVGS